MTAQGWTLLSPLLRSFEELDRELLPADRGKVDRVGAFVRDEVDSLGLSIVDPDVLLPFLAGILAIGKLSISNPGDAPLRIVRSVAVSVLPYLPPEAKS